MSAAFVPGLILRAAPSSALLAAASREISVEGSPSPGLLGPYWTSGIGGGEGRRGELEGETPDRAGVTAAMVFLRLVSERERERETEKKPS